MAAEHIWHSVLMGTAQHLLGCSRSTKSCTDTAQFSVSVNFLLCRKALSARQRAEQC